MKKICIFVTFSVALLFAQDALHEAVDNGDYATAKNMVKNGQAEEIYCGKMPVKNALEVYGKVFRAAPAASFDACPSQFSFGYAPKVCADRKQGAVCLSALSYLQNEGLSGNSAAIESFRATMKVALKNKSYLKPVPVKVDTVVWKPCRKKEAQVCMDSCAAWVNEQLADSSLDSVTLVRVEEQRTRCSEKPQKRVAKTMTVKRPSDFQTQLVEKALEGYWKSPIPVSPEWLPVLEDLRRAKVLADTALPGPDYVRLWAQRHAADSTPVPGGELFRFCAAWEDSVNVILDSAGLSARCPVFGRLEDPRDGQVYKTKEIGGSTWIVQNLNYAVPDSSACYEEDSTNCRSYGRLYTWNAALSACPSGWHLSTDAEWAALEDSAGGESEAALKLRANGSDDFAFSVKFGGYFNQNHIFTIIGEGAYFWTEARDDEKRSFARSLFSTDSNVDRISVDASFGLSVRCVQDGN